MLRTRTDHRCKPVICLNGGMIYDSVKEAAQHLGFEYWRFRDRVSRQEKAEDGKLYIYVSDMAREVSLISEYLMRAERAYSEIRGYQQQREAVSELLAKIQQVVR